MVARRKTILGRFVVFVIAHNVIFRRLDVMMPELTPDQLSSPKSRAVLNLWAAVHNDR